MTNRRQFVTGLASSGVLLLEPPLFAQKPTREKVHPILAEILAQMTEAQQEREITVAVKRFASSLQMLAAFGETHEWDKHFRAGLRRDLRQRGRDVLIADRPNFAAGRREMAALGLTLRNTDDLPLDVLGKGRALDRLAARGVTPLFRHAAAQLQLLIPELAQLRPILLQHTKHEQKCQELAGITLEMEILMTFACAFLYWGVWPPCAIHTAAYFIWKGYIADTYNCF